MKEDVGPDYANGEHIRQRGYCSWVRSNKNNEEGDLQNLKITIYRNQGFYS